MKIFCNGVEYTIRWKYIRDIDHDCEQDHDSTSRIKHKSRKEYTECWIENLEFGIQMVGIAVKIPPDNFSKEVGRKLSLARVLFGLFPDDKESRKFFWHRYFELTNQASKISDLTFVTRSGLGL